MTPTAAQSGNSGFTLVEALLAVLLMSIIMAALASVTAQWLPSWDRGVGRLQRIEAVADGLDRLAGDIAAADSFPPAGTRRRFSMVANFQLLSSARSSVRMTAGGPRSCASPNLAMNEAQSYEARAFHTECDWRAEPV